MSCQVIAPELVAYHFGEIAPEARAEVEAHLLGCQHCLADFIAVKREIETAELNERPSPAARQRLRHAMARELRIEPEPRAWSWWERPLAFGFASAALAIAVMAVGVVSAGDGSPPRTLALEPPAQMGVPARTP